MSPNKLSLNTLETNSKITYYSGSHALYPVDACQSVLKAVLKKCYRLGIIKELIEVKPKEKIAVFRNLVDNTYFERQ